jgi:small subunit ribosomal protein S17
MAEQVPETTKRTLTGKIYSNKGEKSATVLVERRVKHPVYGKYVRRSTKFHVHDEMNECGIGDIVTIEQCRPISKTKTWRLLRVDERAKV